MLTNGAATTETELFDHVRLDNPDAVRAAAVLLGHFRAAKGGNRALNTGGAVNTVDGD